MYLYPQAARRPEDIVMLKVLNQTSCRTKAKGYGSEGRTLVRVANWGWSAARLDVARRVWKLHDSGCKVQVMINKGRISRSVLRVLLKRSKKHGQMPVYDAWHDRNNNNVAGLYVHDKTVTVNGLMGGKHVKIAWTGSQNFTALGTFANNDIILRVVSPQVTEAYNKHFAYIRKRHTQRMHSVPAVTRRPSKP
jgi:phosphatidylserine/phosphatidylglycerophosphate/cardiolipin synthase-like enzyme